MMKIYRLIPFIFILAILCCTTASIVVDYAPFTNHEYPPRDASTIRIYQSQLPDAAYEELGIITAEGREEHASEDILQALKIRAAEKGGSAIILRDMQEVADGTLRSGRYLFHVKKKIYRATVIRFK